MEITAKQLSNLGRSLQVCCQLTSHKGACGETVSYSCCRTHLYGIQRGADSPHRFLDVTPAEAVDGGSSRRRRAAIAVGS